jgi:nucleoside phosphorylase
MRRHDHPDNPYRHLTGIGAAMHIGAFEGKAVARACQHKDTPWRRMKFISGQANGNSPTDWQANVRRGEQLFVQWFFDDFWAQTKIA